MKIESAQVSMMNKHEEKRQVIEKRTEVTSPDEIASLEGSDMTQLESVQVDDELSMQAGAKMYILKLLIQKLTGKDVQWYDDVIETDVSHHGTSNAVSNAENLDREQPPAVQIIVDRYTNESQSNALRVDGQIRLESGEQIDFVFKAEFAQSYSSYQRTIESVDMKDPLVISFNNKSVELDKEDMRFDIDADGQQDSFAHLKKGYGFLALDLNKNSKVDDGKELFGALSGNGFADLAQYDKDKNGFIDENDDVFDSLRVWVKNIDEDKLLSLDEAGIGAISVTNVETPLNIRESGELKGAVRRSGFYLDDKGTPNLIQQVDYVV
ncbi:hypothetical protein N480_05605 [Pseudoalteromonas luteoviolacea S2607]|uniref:hypothetical protein n=1 Tax=Pseudoalteromonas luteoviolacea TaxID=43657 RepID=UPI0007B052B3|nr:hypothetical protein [Pseudoalteromonas luteoviolacea]KZN30428.1 hypothetical protein N480_05605 [Pseudoalteromonas luteoviolacea S2607]